jgi:hypothetical protein
MKRPRRWAKAVGFDDTKRIKIVNGINHVSGWPGILTFEEMCTYSRLFPVIPCVCIKVVLLSFLLSQEVLDLNPIGGKK